MCLNCGASKNAKDCTTYMKIQILSDLHNEFEELPIPHTDADVVVLAGDIDVGTKGTEWKKGFNKPVIYIPGNHEYYHNDIVEINKNAALIKQCQVPILMDSGLVRFICCPLWSDFNLFPDKEFGAKRSAIQRMNDYKVIKYKGKPLTPEDTIEFHKNYLEYIKKELNRPFDGKTVVVTHHAPSIRSVQECYKNDLMTAAYASNLEYLMGPKINLWIHGHVHVSNDYDINGTRVISNPRGYAPFDLNPDFNPELVVEI